MSQTFKEQCELEKRYHPNANEPRSWCKRSRQEIQRNRREM